MIDVEIISAPDGKVIAMYRGNSLTLNCTMEQWKVGSHQYQAGALMQEAFPFLTPCEREFLISGLTPEQWDELFG